MSLQSVRIDDGFVVALVAVVSSSFDSEADKTVFGDGYLAIRDVWCELYCWMDGGVTGTLMSSAWHRKLAAIDREMITTKPLI